jgi:uncharacterized UBP type Zn finger protein
MPRAIHRGNNADDVRRCVHAAAPAHVEPLSSDCLLCRERGDDWVELWLCLSCGWVACSDSSPNQHARAHYKETDHPVAGLLHDSARPCWCYVHRTHRVTRIGTVLDPRVPPKIDDRFLPRQRHFRPTDRGPGPGDSWP